MDLNFVEFFFSCSKVLHSKQETTEDDMAGLQSKFQYLNGKVNQMLTDGRTDRRTDGHHQSISRTCFAIRPKSIL